MESHEVFQHFLAASDRIANSWNLEEGFSGLAHAAQAGSFHAASLQTHEYSRPKFRKMEAGSQARP